MKGGVGGGGRRKEKKHNRSRDLKDGVVQGHAGYLVECTYVQTYIHRS